VQASQSLGARRTSLPSTEREGVKPGEHHDGVGPLPGTISETSVAKLPDERMQPAREADQPTQKRAVGAGTTSLPSRERTGVQPYEHHNGVGPLPGTSSETSVAKLPDERAAATSEGRPGAAAAGTESQKPANDTVAPAENRTPHAAQRILIPETEDKNVISQYPPPAQQVPEHVDRGPDAGGGPADSKSKEEDTAKEKSDERKEERKAEEYREPQRAAEEGASPKQQQEGTKTIQTSEPGSPTQRKGRSGRSSSDSDASHHKKASVMNMVKGEMKVLLGKASRNKGKVEEGEKLKKQGSD